MNESQYAASRVLAVLETSFPGGVAGGARYGYGAQRVLCCWIVPEAAAGTAVQQSFSGQLTGLSILCEPVLYQNNAVCRQEWEQEDHVERCIELLPVMQRVLKHCHTRDPLLWPPTVTTAFNSALEGTPFLQPNESTQGNTTSLASAKIHAGWPVPVHIAHPGLEIG